jgi:hypothetical protein
MVVTNEFVVGPFESLSVAGCERRERHKSIITIKMAVIIVLRVLSECRKRLWTVFFSGGSIILFS